MKCFGRVSGVGAIGAVFAVASACGSSDPIAIGAGARGGAMDAAAGSSGSSGTGSGGGSSATGGQGATGGSDVTSGSGGTGGTEGSPSPDGSAASDGSGATGGSSGAGAADGSAGSAVGDGAAGSADGTADADGSDGSSTCAQLAALVKAQAQQQSCADNSADLKAECEELRTAARCTPQYDAVVACVAGVPASGWACEPNGGPAWVTSCESSQNDLNDCLLRVCASIANLAPRIEEQLVAQTLPAGTGGTIRNGTYFQTKLETYTDPGGPAGPTGVFHQQTVLISGAASGTLTVRSVTVDRDAPAYHEIFSIAISGANMTANVECPLRTAPTTFQFTANGDEFFIIIPELKMVETFTRQQ
jgi:hypothetical protein